ncbi:MAG: aminoglycoside phosphotransferase family protein [Spirochaetes bacterium]|nr:aminoglycoside phosphotransferase family protein [Spirochaetota bacterium]
MSGICCRLKARSVYLRKPLDLDTLVLVLNKMGHSGVVSAWYELEQLSGGTVGEVWLLSGSAALAGGTKIAFQLVLKVQQKWERHGDPDSWRREYDLYVSGLDALFPGKLRWPECYHAAMNEADDEIQLWLEYINGVSGADLPPPAYELAAYELGRFQGTLYASRPTVLNTLVNLSPVDYAERFYKHYRSWDRVYDYIRSEGCAIPKHLCVMLIALDDSSEAVFERIRKLPLVLCHRDFWVENILLQNDTIYLIDWDTAGWGYLGEDVASLLADEADVEHLADNYRRCVPAYYRGFMEFAGISAIEHDCIKDFMFLMYGYRLVEWFLDAEDQAAKDLQLKTLQGIFDIAQSMN